MARILVHALLVLLIAGAALLLGLTGATLHTGRIDPLDWLLPGIGAVIALLLIEHRRNAAPGWVAIASVWASVALPASLFVAVSASRIPYGALLGLVGALALAAIVVRWVLRQRAGVRWSVLLLLCFGLAVGRWAMLPHDLAMTRAANLPVVGVVSALPLYGPTLAEAEQGDPVRGAGHMSPLWKALSASHDLRPLDHLDAGSLASLKTLLIAQPRLLAPDELVALDAWVRGGGYALILADPLLHWPDPRPLGHAGRAPLTSLLDPLLAHWGLRLEPDQYAVEGDPVKRRILKSGALLQMVGASRFALSGKSDTSCQLGEDGLIARCTLGKGRARLIADADWINDMLWTLDPARPEDAAAWTSDAIPALTSWLKPDSLRVDSPGVWLVSQERLIGGLRAALILLLALAAGRALVVPKPMIAQKEIETKADHRKNKDNTMPDTG